MKATCPRCGAKDAHEKVFSVVRTWFRCTKCSFVWRGSLLAIAYSGAPLGSTPDPDYQRSSDGGIVTMEPNQQQPVEPTSGSAHATASEVDVESQLGRVEAAVEHSEPRRPTASLAAPAASIAGSARALRHRTASPHEVDALLGGVENRMDRQLRQQAAASKAGSPANGSRARGEHLTTPGARTSTRPRTSARERTADVESWLAGAEPRPVAAPDPWLTDTVCTPSSSGAESWLTGLKPGASAAVRPPRSAYRSAAEMRQDLDGLPMPDDGPGSNGAGADSGARASLGDMMRRLDSFYSGLVTMERRLDTTEESYSKVTDRWQPIQG